MTYQARPISHMQREILHGHPSRVIWFTGLSGAGKTTLARATEFALFKRGYRTYTIDGDVLRAGLCSDLGFAECDRQENIRRLGEVARLMADAGIVVLVAAISPSAGMRKAVRQHIESVAEFTEVYCSADLAACEARDVKGLYAKARAGGILQFTGIASAYEPPQFPDVLCDTANTDVDTCVAQILAEVVR